MPLRSVLAVVCSVYGALAQTYDFCIDGKPSVPIEWDNSRDPNIEVIYAQAPLFSTNPKIGQKGRFLNMYHTAIALRQTVTVPAVQQKYWTLEFDVQSGSVVDGSLPRIDGETLSWDNEARFCLTEGLLHGREHWTTSFDSVALITGVHARATLEQAVYRFNGTGTKTKPFYGLWNIKPRRSTSPTIRDVTCGDGANWFLHHIQSELKIPLVPWFKLKVSKANIHARELVPVDTSNPAEWSRMVQYYKKQTEFVKGGVSMFERFLAFVATFPCKYVYDANEDIYYRIYGNHFPYFDFEYEEMPLMPSPYVDGIVEV